MEGEDKDPQRDLDKKQKEGKDEEKLPYCTTAPSGEHHRADEEDEPCDDGRSGDVD